MTSVDMAVEIAADSGRVRATLGGALAVWLRPVGLETRGDGETVVVAVPRKREPAVASDEADAVMAARSPVPPTMTFGPPEPSQG